MAPMPRIVICATSWPPETTAALAAKVGAPVATEGCDYDGMLERGPDGGLQLAVRDGGRPLRVDLSSARPRADDLLVRAIGKGRGVQTVFDATAGLGRDSWTMTQAGLDVTACERLPWLAELLRDGLRRAGTEAVEVVAGEAIERLAELTSPVDAVYLDPMFAAHSKSALPKRELQLLRTLCGAGDDAGVELLDAARHSARRRVVVKRRPSAPPLGGVPASSSLQGNRVRFDLYTPLA